ncbi:uncharacterized protein [Ptychodera flava]|uniref:uncharacterized protein n=1 Tax=Ptychodera flava TaxID=63121 RepID=UPI00396A2685
MTSQPSKVERRPLKSVEMVSNSMAIILKPVSNDKEKMKIGRALFEDIQNENKMNFWNRELSDSILELSFLGWFEPDTLFVQGGESQLAIIREAFARRVLKPPRNYTIKQLGDVEPIEFTPVPQSQFVPLTEVLCLIIAELNKRKVIATVEKIRSKLTDCYGDVKLPSEEIMRKSFAHLIKEQKICHTGDGYFIVTPEDFLYLRERSEECTTMADSVNTSPQASPSVGTGNRANKNHKTVRHSVHGDGPSNKGTQTRNSKDGPSPRSKSLPPSLSVREAQNGSSIPVRSRSVSLQRSNSLREKKGQSKANFQRSGSMRTPNARTTTTGVQISNVGSDSEASRVADNCGNAFGFGKLFRKSFGKKGKKVEEKRDRDKEKDKDREKEKEKNDGKENKERKIVELHNYSAQFPPENMAQLLQEMKQKAATAKGDKSGLNRSEANVKGSPKKDRVIISNTVEHIPGPSTSKEKKHKVYRKKDDVDPLPESEAEFILPTKMYDEKCRTKAVSEQLRKQYSKKHKENPWKYLREKEGEVLKKNGEKDAATNGVASTRPKRSSGKERPKSDPRDIRLRTIQHQRTAEYVSKLPTANGDGKGGKHAENEIYLDGVDSSEMTTSDNNRMMSHRSRSGKSGLHSPRKAAADHDTIDSSDFTEESRERHVPRRYRAIKRDAAKIIRDIESRVDDSTDTFTSDQDDSVYRHRPMSDTFMLASNQDNRDMLNALERENYEDDRDCITPPLVVNHDLLDMPLPEDFQEPHNISVDSSEPPVPPSGQEYEEHPLRLSPIRESQESQLDRERSSQQSLDSSKAIKDVPKDYIEHDEAPTLSTDSTASTVIRKESTLSPRDSSHQPSESFSSSACDSGFNSPRGSIALSRHSNSPVEHMTYEQLREKRLSYCIPEGIELKDFEPQNVKSHVQKTKNGSPLDRERPSMIPKLKHGNNGAPAVSTHPSKSGGSTPESTEREITQLPKDHQHKELPQTRQHEALRVL